MSSLAAQQRKSDYTGISLPCKTDKGAGMGECSLGCTSNRELELSWLLPQKDKWESKRTAKCGFRESTSSICWLFKANASRLTALRENIYGSSKAKFIRLLVELESLGSVSEQERSRANIYRSLEFSNLVIWMPSLWSKELFKIGHSLGYKSFELF